MGPHARANVEAAWSIRHLGSENTVRDSLGRVLVEAYSRGLLSDRTLSHRVDVLVDGSVVDVDSLVEDLAIRVPRRGWRARLGLFGDSARPVRGSGADAAPRGLLTVRWSSRWGMQCCWLG